MIWVKFSSLDAFNVWHEEIKQELGLPKISTDSEGNEVPDKTITTDYAKPIIVQNNDVRAFIDEFYFHGESQIRFDMELSEIPFRSVYDTQP